MIPTQEEELYLQRNGYYPIAGVDEVGRGALAGPVMAAAVIFPMNLDTTWLGLVRDSKLLSPAKRKWLAPRIEDVALATAIGQVESWEIDLAGIVPSTRQAMERALAGLAVRPAHLLVDAIEIRWSGIPCRAIIRGDQRSLSIAAASIVAKVARDQLMSEQEIRYPGYDFEKNKGYGTSSHMVALHTLGASPIHRKTFSPVNKLIGARAAVYKPTITTMFPRRPEFEVNQVAESYLLNHGYEIVARNHETKYGTVSFVTRKANDLIFVGILKDRRRRRKMITGLRSGAMAYLADHSLNQAGWRVEVLAIRAGHRESSIHHDVDSAP